MNYDPFKFYVNFYYTPYATPSCDIYILDKLLLLHHTERHLAQVSWAHCPFWFRKHNLGASHDGWLIYATWPMSAPLVANLGIKLWVVPLVANWSNMAWNHPYWQLVTGASPGGLVANLATGPRSIPS